MPKKKRKKYSFLAEQKRIENQEIEHLRHVFEEEQKLANVFLDEYAPKFPQLYQSFQEQLEASIPGCIFILIDKQKASEKGMPLQYRFVPKTLFEEMLEKFSQHPEVEKLLDYIDAWQEHQQEVPLGVQIGAWIKATTFPVPVSAEIIDSEPVAPTSSSEELPEEPNSPSSDT